MSDTTTVEEGTQTEETGAAIVTPPPPPRTTGDAQRDAVAQTQWFAAFYNSIVRGGYFVKTAQQFDTSDIDEGNLVDPASATIASAQKTANEAYLLAGSAKKSADDIAKGLLSGSFTVSNTATTGTGTFSPALGDANYVVMFQAQASTGTPAAGSQIVASYTKTASGFTATLVAAPGAGNSVTFDWFAFRKG